MVTITYYIYTFSLHTKTEIFNELSIQFNVNKGQRYALKQSQINFRNKKKSKLKKIRIKCEIVSLIRVVIFCYRINVKSSLNYDFLRNEKNDDIMAVFTI